MLKFPRSGKPDAYITVAGYPGETAKVINSSGIAIFNLDAGSRWAGTNLEERAYLVIRDLVMDVANGNQAVRINGPMQLDEYRGKLAKSRGLRHNIWVVNNDISGGNGHESVLGAGYGAHDVVISNNRIHDALGGMNSYLFSDGTIIEWNTVFNTSSDQDDAGAIKSMAPGVIIRYNTVHGNNRNPLSKKPGWAPASEGGKQWRFLQGVTGIYADWAMLTPEGGNNFYPEPLRPADPANYIYGNTVYNNNGGIFAFKSDNVQVYDNVIYDNGRAGIHGFVEGDPAQKRLDFVGPAGHGIRIAASSNTKVWNNISYNNLKAGFATSGPPGLQVWNNVFFGNDLAQIHVEKSGEIALGFNTILATEKQGPPFRHNKTDFGTTDAFRQKYPYFDEATQVVPLAAGMQPLAQARQRIKNPAVTQAAWQAAYARLNAKATEAGMRKPAVVATVPQAPYDPSGGLQLPLPKALPGIIEFENYDVGGPSVSFFDTSTDNEGEHYRKDAVDIKANTKAGNGAVGWLHAKRRVDGIHRERGQSGQLPIVYGLCHARNRTPHPPVAGRQAAG
jgi:parallel beta-helix repeat protein